jgi:hypothetical protein
MLINGLLHEWCVWCSKFERVVEVEMVMVVGVSLYRALGGLGSLAESVNLVN